MLAIALLLPGGQEAAPGPTGLASAEDPYCAEVDPETGQVVVQPGYCVPDDREGGG